MKSSRVSVRALNCLRYDGYVIEGTDEIDWKRVSQITHAELLRIPNLGEKSFAYIMQELKARDLPYWEPPFWRPVGAIRCPHCEKLITLLYK